MEDEVKPFVFVVVGGLEEGFDTEALKAELMDILDDVIEIDKYPREKEGSRGGKGTGEEIDQPRPA